MSGAAAADVPLSARSFDTASYGSAALAVRLRGVVKRYGSVRALDGLSLDVPRGACCALIGPNGSGKTTTFGVLAGLLRPQAGEIDVLGHGRFDAARDPGRVSLMPQDSAPSPHLSVRELLSFYAELGGASRREARQQADHWLERVRLTGKARAKLGELSHGMRRRFSVAQALLGKPELILLDEPTSGLDPEMVVDIRQLLAEQRGRATLIVSSHILSELETLCDYAVILDAGRAVRQGTLRELTAAGSLVRVTLARPPDLPRLGAALPGAELTWRAPHLTLQSNGKDPIEAINARLLRALLDQGAAILELHAGESLEATYLASKQAKHTGESA